METTREHLVNCLNECGVIKAEIREPRVHGGVIEIITGDGTVFLLNPPWVDYNALQPHYLKKLQEEKGKSCLR